MEIIVKIQTDQITVKRELACDICGNVLFNKSYNKKPCMYSEIKAVEHFIYTIFWKDSGGLYLEKYICGHCYKKLYRKDRAIPFEQAPEIYQRALKRDFQRDWYGIITPCSSVEEWKLLTENPFLIELWGEKF